MTWREQIRPIVDRIIREVGTDDRRALRRALIDRRPHWVSSCSWQTRIWRDEVALQLGTKRRRIDKLIQEKRHADDAKSGQLKLFDGEERTP